MRPRVSPPCPLCASSDTIRTSYYEMDDGTQCFSIRCLACDSVSNVETMREAA
jgi:hypothetical protein